MGIIQPFMLNVINISGYCRALHLSSILPFTIFFTLFLRGVFKTLWNIWDTAFWKNNYSRHPLSRTSKGAAKKFETVNVQDSEKSTHTKKCILHTWKYINLTCNTLRGKIETKGTLLGEKSKIAWSAKINPCEIKEFRGWAQPRKFLSIK